MGALADNSAFIQDNDLFGILNGGNALGHDQQSAGAGLFFKCLA